MPVYFFGGKGFQTMTITYNKNGRNISHNFCDGKYLLTEL